MKGILEKLLELQLLEFGGHGDQTSQSQAAALRAIIPPPVLVHYDRFRARGKKGVAVVRNQACGGCHMSVPIGLVSAVMRGEEIQLCENCGRYLCLPPPAEGQAAPAGVPPAARKANKAKALAHAV
ncbi:MAG: hypothetical protein DME25_11490 [Verrucomicrobia bacterium]|nr:MAG: hypothetical protein DME25_11490 [Verrucomicrobiota bacterium]